MKLVMQKWQWLAGLVAAGMICATYLLAQTQTTLTSTSTGTTASATVAPPSSTEAVDSALLIQAVNAGDTQTALEILHNYGIADNTLLSMATRLGKTPAPVGLKELFLKFSFGGLTLADPALLTNVQASFQAANTALGYQRPVWIPRRPDTNAITSYATDLIQCPVAPIAVLNIRLNDPCFIRYFEWYDRYAESLHSVMLNGPNLTNAKFDKTNYDQANLNLNALFQLIKARNPNAFVWLSVVKEDDRSDEPWLKAMTFRPDGLQISNLRQFNSPFAETRNRYMAIVGTNMAMMVAGFYGDAAALQKSGATLTAAMQNNNPQAEATATAQLGGIGAAIGQNLSRLETNLQSLGYRGLSAHWLLLAALANSTNATPTNQTDLLDPRAGLLDAYFEQGDIAHLSSLATDMVSKSAPGDMNWTVGKFYQGMALLSQTPPDTTDGIPVLDEILAFNFTNRPGRDHYIFGAVKWRIYAAVMSGDTNKGPELVQWVQSQALRQDLKSAFLKQYGGFLTPTPTTSQ